MHTRFALAIDADPALVSGGRADIEKAHHWYSAHNTTWALISAWQASVQASRAVAHAERLMLLARVLELWDQVPDAAERDRRRPRAGARRGGGRRRATRGSSSAVSRSWSRRSASSTSATEPVRFALLLSRRYSFRTDLGLDARDHRGPGPGAGPGARVPSREQARTQLLLAAAHCGMRRGRAAVPGLGGGGAAARARGWATVDAEAQALAILAMIEAGPSRSGGSRTASRSGWSRRPGELAQQAGAYQPILKLVIYESHLLCGAGEYERAAAVARQGIADAERHGLARTSGAFLAINLAEPLLYLGRWDEAAEVAERALDLAPPPRTRAACGSLRVRSRSPAATPPPRPGERRRAGRCCPASGTTTSTTCRRPSSTSTWRWPPRGRPPPSPWPPRRSQRYDLSAEQPPVRRGRCW